MAYVEHGIVIQYRLGAAPYTHDAHQEFLGFLLGQLSVAFLQQPGSQIFPAKWTLSIGACQLLPTFFAQEMRALAGNI